MIEALQFMEPSQEQLMQWLTKLPIDLNKLYISPFRQDQNPTCSYWYSNNGTLYLHDFGTGKMYTPVKAAMALWNVDWKAANDRLVSKYAEINQVEVDIHKKQDVVLDFVFDEYKGDYWQSFGITPATLKRFNVRYARTVYKNETVSARSTPNNPIFVYTFPSKRTKIYRPLTPEKAKKWGGNSIMTDIGGINCLAKKGVVCFITSSVKDCMVLWEHGFPAVCLQGEGYGAYGKSVDIMGSLVKELKSRFRYVFFFMDSDPPGIAYSERLSALHGLECCFTEKEKDISDYRKKFKGNLTTRLLKKIIVKAWKNNKADYGACQYLSSQS